jgi:hypothetical protein
MDRLELLHSRQKHLTNATRGHFWTGEEERRVETLRGEGKIYDTSFHILTKFLREIVVRDAEKRESLEKLIEDMEEAAFRYIESRVRLARSKIAMTGGRGDAAAVEEADIHRRRAHEALMDSIQIAVRNFKEQAEEEGGNWQIPESTWKLVETRHPNFRDIVGQAAVDFIWQILDEEEAREREQRMSAA